ncbi:MAG TPA: hypothetical protein VN841_29160 [Bryobacteraceae bacterium]|nr:hypothetical protein [Bryobacteraceae bacterium]
MLNPAVIVDAVVAALQTIADLATAMNGDIERIAAFHDQYGLNVPLALAIHELKAPGVLVAWEGTQAATFNGADILRHQIGIYVRLANQAGRVPPAGYDSIWWTITNGGVNGGAQNIRQIQIIPPTLEIMDTPSVQRHTDADGLDFLIGSFVIPEIGDN